MKRDQRILIAAEKLFHERSFDGVGVDAIAREAGIVGSGVYRHFAGKEQILAALISDAGEKLLAAIGEPLPDPNNELHRLLRTHVEFAMDHPRLADIWQREHHIVQNEEHADVHRLQRQYVERWLTCLDACYPGHSREDLLAAVRAVHALIMSDSTRRAASPASGRLRELLLHLSEAALTALEGD